MILLVTDCLSLSESVAALLKHFSIWYPFLLNVGKALFSSRVPSPLDLFPLQAYFPTSKWTQ